MVQGRGGPQPLVDLPQQELQLAGLGHDERTARLDRRHVDQVPDEPVHPRARPLDHLCACVHLAPFLRGAFLCQHLGRQRDPLQDRSQVVGDHRKKGIARIDRFVGAGALRQEIEVGLVPLQPEELGQGFAAGEALASQIPVLRRPSRDDGSVLARTLRLQRRVGSRILQLVVRGLSRCLQDGIGLRSRSADDLVGVLGDRRASTLQLTVGPAALHDEALVGRFPVGRRLRIGARREVQIHRRSLLL